MLNVKYDDAKKLNQIQAIRSKNFFHFRDIIAIPGMNDLMFRRLLFTKSSWSRREALKKIKGFLGSGKTSQSPSLLPSDLSILRDMTLFFGNKEEIESQFDYEANYLPQHQIHRHHDEFAKIIHVIRNEGEGSSALKSLYSQVENNTPSVSDKWARFWLEDEDEVTCGPEFYALNEHKAEEFCSLVNEVQDMEEVSSLKNVGLCALGYVVDPQLDSPKIIAKEKQLLKEILQIKKDTRVLNQTEFDPWEIADIDVEHT